MAGIASVGTTSGGPESAAFQASYQAAVLQKGKQVMASQGAAAIKLIQSAIVVDPSVGQSLNVKA